LVPGLPVELDGLVARATRRAAEDRPADAETLLFAVRGVRAALGIPTVPVPIPIKAGGRPGPEPGPKHAAPVPPPRNPTRALTALELAPELTELPPYADDPTGTGLLSGPSGGGRWARNRWLLLGVGLVLLLGVFAGIGGWFLGGGSGVLTPTLVGLDEPAAQRALSDLGLVGVISERHTDQVPEGVVAEVNPVAGTEVGKGSQVTLVVSTGHPRVPPIPVGTPVGTAAGLLRDADLTANPDTTTRRNHPTAPVGTVIGTVPATGTQLTMGASVNLVLSKGPARNRDRGRDEDNSDGGFGRGIGDLLDRVLGGGN
jgi:serine/threonine-protein kinase